MKRKIALGMIFVMICYSIVLVGSVNAELPSPELLPQVIICNPSCGPYYYRCSEIEIQTTNTHSVNWNGYEKTCVYNEYDAYTFAICRNCSSRSVSGTHWHGDDGHEAEICGLIDSRVCTLDSTDLYYYFNVLK